MLPSLQDPSPGKTNASIKPIAHTATYTLISRPRLLRTVYSQSQFHGTLATSCSTDKKSGKCHLSYPFFNIWSAPASFPYLKKMQLKPHFILKKLTDVKNLNDAMVHKRAVTMRLGYWRAAKSKVTGLRVK